MAGPGSAVRLPFAGEPDRSVGRQQCGAVAGPFGPPPSVGPGRLLGLLTFGPFAVKAEPIFCLFLVGLSSGFFELGGPTRGAPAGCLGRSDIFF